MSTAYLVLLVLLIVYVPIYIWVYKNPEKAERYHLVTYGPALMIKTHLGINLMGRIGRYQRFWRFVGFLSKLTSAVLLFLMMYTLIVALMALPSMVGNSSIGIEYALAIPGFNPILPLSYGIAALLFAMVVHELGHGIQARSNGIDVDSSGLLYGVVPLGAFVEPNEEQMKAAPRRPRMDVYTAGITMNTFWAIVAIAILMLSCASISSPYDDEPGVYGVDKGSPAYDSGIPLTALITGASLEGSDVVMPVDSAVLNKVVSIEFEDSSQSFDPTKRYTFQYIYKGDTGTTSKAVQMGAFVNSVVKSSPADTAGIAPGMFLYSITLNGEETLVGSINEFTSFMKTTSPGDTVVLATVDVSDSPVVVYHDPVALTASGGIGFLGAEKKRVCYSEATVCALGRHPYIKSITARQLTFREEFYSTASIFINNGFSNEEVSRIFEIPYEQFTGYQDWHIFDRCKKTEAKGDDKYCCADEQLIQYNRILRNRYQALITICDKRL